MTAFMCDDCKGSRQGKKSKTGWSIPRGWKRLPDGRLFCAECVRNAFVLRAATFSLASVDGGWGPFDQACEAAWRLTTQATNWLVRHLALADGDAEKFVPPYLYPGLRAAFPALPSQSAVCLINSVQAKYLKQRRDCWAGRASFPNARYPQPLPIDADSYRASLTENVPHVELSLPGEGGLRRFRLRLRGGQEFARQMADFRTIVAGEAIRGEAAIYRQGRHTLLKLVARFPRPRKREADRCLVLTTDPKCFWVAEIDRRQAWVLNADHLRRAEARNQHHEGMLARLRRHEEHLSAVQRLGQDAKAGRRLGNNLAADLQPRLEARCRKDRDRMRSWVQEAAAHLVGFAVRQRVAEVFYLDRDRGYLPSFPWHALHSRLAVLCDQHGIAFYSESGVPGSPPTVTNSDETIDIAPTTEEDRWLRVTRLREMAARKVLAARSRKGSHPRASVP